ncbi:hypothetical protein PIB30_081315 [Stylosanthes scabra]|uniref:Uncharacterized protein n=1 Tax=Stylosanthes scabra TaxID=79078 RepID=A0ABU6XQ50_9FABA|nr:hypothetical protein [Stylosanthes scabra]
MHGVREKGSPSDWIPHDILRWYEEYWASPKYQALQRTNKTNLARCAGGSLPTGGIYYLPYYYEENGGELGRETMQSELFEQTHTKKKD